MDFDRLVGKHLQSASGKYEEAEKLANRVGDRLQSVTGHEATPEVVAGEAPVLPPET